jgi:hypothetical protein
VLEVAMFNVLRQLRIFAAALVIQYVAAETLPSIFGSVDATTPVPSNVAQYILDLEEQGVYLHYHGHQQIFSLALSPALKQHLQSEAATSSSIDMPLVYGTSQLVGGECNCSSGSCSFRPLVPTCEKVCDWSKIPGWSNSSSGADAHHVFYGREIRHALNTPYGNAIHLSLGPERDQEGWTHEEMHENFEFWKATQKDGEKVGRADGLRKFRENVAAQLGGTFKERWGAGVTTKAHRFALQMYTSASQSDDSNPGARFFEKFPKSIPPTTEVLFFETEDGFKGTPTPKTQMALSLTSRQLRG